MSWRTTCVADERMKFMEDWRDELWSFAELCRRYGVSRKTGYKLVARFQAQGATGLFDRSRAPQHNPRAIAKAVVEQVLWARREHPSWGPKKLHAWLGRRQPDVILPALSTIGLLLDRHGLVSRRRLRAHGTPSEHLTPAVSANDVWGIDFKGWFRTGDGRRCDPLSLSDLGSRYVLRLQVVERPDGDHVWPIVEAALREFGLPRAIRSDNGPPFASVGAGGLSPLAVKLIKAGVAPERIMPGKPQQNGRHERLHQTLKRETANPPAASAAAQQRRFDHFRRQFNEERPHEALAQDTPAQHFGASTRPFSGRLRQPEYEQADQIRRVHPNGEINWAGERLFISQVLIGEPLGLTQTADGAYTVHYGPVLLGTLGPGPRFRKAKTQPKTRTSE